MKWPATDIDNIYRLGYHGKIDVQGIEMTSDGTRFYLEHLPVLGKQQPLSVRIGQPLVQASPPLLNQAAASKREALDTKFNIGDKVRIAVSPEELQVLQVIMMRIDGQWPLLCIP